VLLSGKRAVEQRSAGVKESWSQDRAKQVAHLVGAATALLQRVPCWPGPGSRWLP